MYIIAVYYFPLSNHYYVMYVGYIILHLIICKAVNNW